MNTQQLYDELVALTLDGDTFYFQDFVLDGSIYRIFNYRLASYTDFLKPSALECRGHMFEVDALGQHIRLASRPMQKFFNLGENPMTMNLDLSQVDTVELKADGSLMSSYIHDGNVRLKSKGSLFSEQAIDAMKWLMNWDDERRSRYYGMIYSLEQQGYTVNFEWTAPFNRIVIGYVEPKLTVLNVRHRETGQYMSREMLESTFMEHWNVISRVDTNGLSVANFVQQIPAMLDDIEGYVCHIGDLWFKVKTEKYISLHHAKDSINNPRRLFEAIVDEGIDDLRSMFSTDALAIQTIDEMQTKVTALYNSVVGQVETYHSNNKTKDRKDYAIGAQTLNIGSVKLLSLAMNLYLGKDAGYKDFVKARYKEFGFRDTVADKKED